MSFGKPRETRSYTWRPALFSVHGRSSLGTNQLSHEPRSLSLPSSRRWRGLPPRVTPRRRHTEAAPQMSAFVVLLRRSRSRRRRSRRSTPSRTRRGRRTSPTLRDARRASPSHTDVSPTASRSRAAPDARRRHHSARGALVHPRGRRRARQSRSARRARRAHPRRAESSARRTRSAPPAISAFPIPVPRGAPRRPRRRSAREILCGIHSSSARSRHPSAFATRARRAASATDRSRASARGASTASSRRPPDKRPRPRPRDKRPRPRPRPRPRLPGWSAACLPKTSRVR